MSEEASSPFTQAQEDAITRAYEILGEHFDASIIMVDSETQAGDGDARCCYWKGGHCRCLGMAHFAVKEITDTQRKAHEP